MAVTPPVQRAALLEPENHQALVTKHVSRPTKGALVLKEHSFCCPLFAISNTIICYLLLKGWAVQLNLTIDIYMVPFGGQGARTNGALCSTPPAPRFIHKSNNAVSLKPYARAGKTSLVCDVTCRTDA